MALPLVPLHGSADNTATTSGGSIFSAPSLLNSNYRRILFQHECEDRVETKISSLLKIIQGERNKGRVGGSMVFSWRSVCAGTQIGRAHV